MKKFYFLLFFFIPLMVYSQNGFLIDHTTVNLSQIPDNYIDSAKKKVKVMYFRRSHGSHIDVGGMSALMRYSSSYQEKYAFSKDGRSGSLLLDNQWHSLDFENDTWVSLTRTYLDDPANANINVMMWAWSSNFYLMDVDRYLADMETLIGEYGPNGSKILGGTRTVAVTFIFQTACGQKSIDRNKKVYDGNMKIRQFCKDHDRILFDFNDIECYDPNGNYYGDGNPDKSYTNIRKLNDDLAYISDSTNVSVYSGGGNWGIEWMNRNPNAELTKLSADDICTVCEHSMGTHEGETKDNSRIHCVLKGQAAWWMWAKLAGWEYGGSTGINQTKKKTEYFLNNYPNPFHEYTTIKYALTMAAQVKLEVWNTAGKRIALLINKNQLPGNYEIPFESQLQSGVYYYSLKINGEIQAKKMMKIK